MTSTPRLDRLSALLEGLAPRVEVARPGAAGPGETGKDPGERFLHLYLIADGQVRFRITPGDTWTISAPAIIICPSGTVHALETLPPGALPGVLCAKAFLEGPAASLLLNEFPEPRAVSLAGAEPSLRHIVELIASELLIPRCGQPALLDRAGDILFIGLLRHLVAHPRSSDGLFTGLADPRIARTLVAMHALPNGKWTLESLAAEAGMSRTAFANTFRDTMRQPPGKYLSQLRLAIAQQAVRSGRGLKRAAQASGYTNPSALSRALSRSTKPEPRAGGEFTAPG